MDSTTSASMTRTAVAVAAGALLGAVFWMVLLFVFAAFLFAGFPDPVDGAVTAADVAVAVIVTALAIYGLGRAGSSVAQDLGHPVAATAAFAVGIMGVWLVGALRILADDPQLLLRGGGLALALTAAVGIVMLARLRVQRVHGVEEPRDRARGR